MNKVFIIVLNWNGKENTVECLKSLEKLDSSGLETQIVVVDNASSDSSVEKISEKYPTVTVLSNKENLGFSGGNNVGIRYALSKGAHYVIILNNDTLVDKALVEELVAIANEENVGIVAPKIYFAKGNEFHKDRYKKDDLGKVIWYAGGIIDWKNVIAYHRGVDDVDKGQYQKLTSTEFASGCCMLVTREVFEKVGLFDEKYYLYYEDNDLSIKTKKAGYKILYNPKAIVWHKNAGSAGGSGSKLQDYYITRNRLLFGMRYGQLRSKFALIRESFRLFFEGRIWQKKGVRDFYLGKFGKGSY